MEGSETLQCDRRTGACECVTGVAGAKCDHCARGTTGTLPNCEPCGECFDDWDDIISDLRGRYTTTWTTSSVTSEIGMERHLDAATFLVDAATFLVDVC